MSSIPEYQKNDNFHMDRTKTVGTVQYFTLKYKGKALHRMIKMYMDICLRFFFCYYF